MRTLRLRRYAARGGASRAAEPGRAAWERDGGSGDARDHRLADQAYGLDEVEPGVYKLGHPRLPAPTVRFEEIEGVVRMIDHRHGTELKVLDGISMEQIERLGSDGGIPAIPGLVIVDGDGSVDVELPDDMRRADFVWYKTDGRGFTAYAHSDGFLTVHRSQDGRVWRQTHVIGDDVSEPTDIRNLDPRTDLMEVETTDGTHWMSTDGQEWKKL